MIFRLTLAWLFIAGVALATVGTQADDAGNDEDPVVASFERELNHETTPRKDVTRDAIDEDELYALVNKPLQSEDADEDTDSQETGAGQ